jgi:hypothetical protein
LKSLQRAIEEGYTLSQWLIKGIHQQLLSFERGASKSPGRYKNKQNDLADKMKKNIIFIPISPEKLQVDWILYFNTWNKAQIQRW